MMDMFKVAKGKKSLFARLSLIPAVFIASFSLMSTAKAEVISISGATFIQQCPCNVSGNLPDVNAGVLVPTDSTTLYAPVDFPVNGQKICSISMVYQDTNNSDTMIARLLRKSATVGVNPFANPTVIGSVASAAGVSPLVRKATTTLTNSPVINDTTGFYFVRVTVPTINLNLLGVQIDYRPACP